MKASNGFWVATLFLLFVGAVWTFARSGNKAVEVDAGDFAAKNRSQSNIGAAPAMKRLAQELKKDADASRFVVKWRDTLMSSDGSEVFREKIEYDRGAKTLKNQVNDGYIYLFQNVTDSVIESTASANGMTDDLPNHGASREN